VRFPQAQQKSANLESPDLHIVPNLHSAAGTRPRVASHSSCWCRAYLCVFLTSLSPHTGLALIGSKAPFRLMSDHVRCGRLEAATSSVRDWCAARCITDKHSADHQ